MPNFPTSLDALANPTATTLRNDPGFELHQAISTLNDIAEALEAKVGIGASVPATGTVLRGTGAGASAYGALAASDLTAGMGYRKLAETTLGAPAATVDFTNISQAYSGLVVHLATANTSVTANIIARLSFDGTTFDASGSYDWTYTNQTSVSGTTGATTAADTGFLLGSNGTFGSFPAIIAEFPFYSATGPYKTYLTRSMLVLNFSGTGYTVTTAMGQHRASNTNPIRGLRIAVASGQFLAASRFVLFGIPGTLG